MNFFPNNGFIPNMDNTFNMINDIYNKLNDYDNKIKALEDRISKLERENNSINNYKEPDKSMYML